MNAKAQSTLSHASHATAYDLGTFEVFNFRSAAAVFPNVGADELLSWDHDGRGEAEFWPAGDCLGVALLFDDQSAVTASEILALDTLLAELGDDSLETYVRLYYLTRFEGIPLAGLDADTVRDFSGHVFSGPSFIDLREHAAFELFELYYPTEYALWEQSACDGLLFDEDRFLDSPGFGTHEITFGATNVLVVVAE